MLVLIGKLYRTGLLTPVGVFRLVEAALTTGVNLMALLRVAAHLHPQRMALRDEDTQLSYRHLWEQAESLATTLQRDYGIQPRQRVAIACRNHAAGIKAIFAASRLGAHVFLFNPDLSADQLQALVDGLTIDFYIYDHRDETPTGPWLESALQTRKAIPAYHPAVPSIDQLSLTPVSPRPFLRAMPTGSIVVMTGGTTGQPKPASRKPAVLNFLPPFMALLEQVHLDRYRSLYIATPIYHGFGLAALLIGVLLGAELYVTRRFEAAQACQWIETYHIQVVTLVPLMLRRMLKHEPRSLPSLRCVLSGGAMLTPDLAQATLTQFGPVLFNLYGTSEAGFCILAPPALLGQKPTSIGQPIRGVRAAIVDHRHQQVSPGTVGRLCIGSAWATQQNRWVETGDLAYRDPQGDIVLCGRVDDMVVSGGENVYPVDLENILLHHPAIEMALVVGIPDAEFGQRLKAIVVQHQEAALDEPTLRHWLKPRIARYQMPAIIEFRDQLPCTPLGKPDRRGLAD